MNIKEYIENYKARHQHDSSPEVRSQTQNTGEELQTAFSTPINGSSRPVTEGRNTTTSSNIGHDTNVTTTEQRGSITRTNSRRHNTPN